MAMCEYDARPTLTEAEGSMTSCGAAEDGGNYYAPMSVCKEHSNVIRK